MTKLSISQLRLDGGTQPRAALNEDTINEYTEAMRDGAQFPAVEAYHDGSAYWLTDGFHRIQAAIRADLTVFEVDVHQGTLQDAQWASYTKNGKHGLRRSREDMQRAVIAALKHPNGAGKSDREIGRHVGVDHVTVARHREKLVATGEIHQSTQRVGGDGRSINTTNIGNHKPASSRPASVGSAEDIDDFLEAQTDDPPETSTKPGAPDSFDPIHNALERAYFYAATRKDGWYTYAFGNFRGREGETGLDGLVKAGYIEAIHYGQPTERLRITLKGCEHLGKQPPAGWLTGPAAPLAPLPPVPPKPKSELEQRLNAAGIEPFRIVTHNNGWSGTFTAGFFAETQDDAHRIVQEQAQAIAALGFTVINAGIDILPGLTVLGFGGQYTPMVHFAEAGYVIPEKPKPVIPQPGQRFGVLLLDPPWRFEVYSRDTGLGRSAESHYGTMCLEDLMALPMQNLMADDCAVFMWTTWPTLPEALQLGAAWGLTYKTCAFNWVKLNKNQTDTPFTGMGYWTRANSEPCLLFSRGTPRRESRSVPQILLDWESGIFQTETVATPIGVHSEKPAAVQERIEALVQGPYCEVFAREARPGWASLGNEIDGRSIQAVLAELEREAAS